MGRGIQTTTRRPVAGPRPSDLATTLERAADLLVNHLGVDETGRLRDSAGDGLERLISDLEKKASVVLARFGLLQRPDLAQAAASDAVFRLLLRLREIEKPLPYAREVARNVARNLARRELGHRQRHLSLSESPANEAKRPSSLLDLAISSEDDDAEALRRRDLLEAAYAVVRRRLPPQHRRRYVELLDLVLEGRSFAEAARCLGVSRQRVSQMLKTIKELILASDRSEPPDDDGGNGGGGGNRLPPSRDGPGRHLGSRKPWRVAGLRTGTSCQKEMTSNGRERPVRDDRAPCLGLLREERDHDPDREVYTMAAELRRRPNQALAPLRGAEDDDARLRDFRRLLLQLPAFRESGLAPDPRGLPGVDNLAEIFAALGAAPPRFGHPCGVGNGPRKSATAAPRPLYDGTAGSLRQPDLVEAADPASRGDRPEGSGNDRAR